MSQRALTLPEFTPFPPPDPFSRSADSAARSSVPATLLEMDVVPESATLGQSALKGAGFAIFFEAIAAAGLYGGWLLWKILR